MHNFHVWYEVWKVTFTQRLSKNNHLKKKKTVILIQDSSWRHPIGPFHLAHARTTTKKKKKNTCQSRLASVDWFTAFLWPHQPMKTSLDVGRGRQIFSVDPRVQDHCFLWTTSSWLLLPVLDPLPLFITWDWSLNHSPLKQIMLHPRVTKLPPPLYKSATFAPFGCVHLKIAIRQRSNKHLRLCNHNFKKLSLVSTALKNPNSK